MQYSGDVDNDGATTKQQKKKVVAQKEFHEWIQKQAMHCITHIHLVWKYVQHHGLLSKKEEIIE